MVNYLNNMNLYQKIFLVPIILILLLILQGVVGLYQGQQVDQVIRNVTEDLAVDSGISTDILHQIFLQRIAMKNYIKSSKETDVAAFEAYEKASQETIQKAQQAISNPTRMKLLDEIQSLHQEYSSAFHEVVVSNMMHRHTLVKKTLDAKGPATEKLLSKIMKSAHRDHDIEAAFFAGVAQKHLLLARLYVYKYLTNNDDVARERVMQELKALMDELVVMHNSLENPQRRSLSSKAKLLLKDYHDGFAGVVKAISERNKGIKKMDELGPSIVTRADALQNSITKSLNEESERVHDQMNTSKWLTIAITLFSVILGILLSWLIVRAIVNRIRQINALTKKIANGDLTGRLPVQSQDELGELAIDFNRLIDKLEAFIGLVQSSVGQLASASDELSVVTTENRKTVQTQAMQTAQVATAVEEMTHTLHEVARNVNEATDVTEHAQQAALRGREIEAKALADIQVLSQEIQQTASIIENVGQTSETVNTVVDVINGIAEQTNLLALNAAIEAARAGEQGRGFAVVADEVRTLAGRTQSSTEEIRQTVESLRNSVLQAIKSMGSGIKQVDTVVEQANQVDDSLILIVSGVEKIDEMTTQIATATEEQGAVAEDISRNVVNINDQAEQTSSAIEQINAAAGDLAHLASNIQDQVSQFKVRQ